MVWCCRNQISHRTSSYRQNERGSRCLSYLILACNWSVCCYSQGPLLLFSSALGIGMAWPYYLSCENDYLNSLASISFRNREVDWQVGIAEREFIKWVVLDGWVVYENKRVCFFSMCRAYVRAPALGSQSSISIEVKEQAPGTFLLLLFHEMSFHHISLYKYTYIFSRYK